MTTAKTFVWSFALCLAGSGALALAQSNNKAAPTRTCEHGDQCPMKAASELSDVKVELTKDGAVIRLTAKRTQDVSKVQESARQIAAAVSGGDCVMHMGPGAHQHEHNHEHDHEHGHEGAGAK